MVQRVSCKDNNIRLNPPDKLDYRFFSPHLFDAMQIGSLDNAESGGFQLICVNGYSIDLDAIRLNEKSVHREIQPK